MNTSRAVPQHDKQTSYLEISKAPTGKFFVTLINESGRKPLRIFNSKIECTEFADVYGLDFVCVGGAV